MQSVVKSNKKTDKAFRLRDYVGLIWSWNDGRWDLVFMFFAFLICEGQVIILGWEGKTWRRGVEKQLFVSLIVEFRTGRCLKICMGFTRFHVCWTECPTSAGEVNETLFIRGWIPHPYDAF